MARKMHRCAISFFLVGGVLVNAFYTPRIHRNKLNIIETQLCVATDNSVSLEEIDTSIDNNNATDILYVNSTQIEPRNNNEPICRVVAPSDGKIPQLSLSQSSASLLEKVELLYTVQSQKKLRDLDYSSKKEGMLSKEYMMDVNGVNETSSSNNNVTTTSDNIEQQQQEEKKLVSILKQSLEDGGFKLMNQRDLDLCFALNAGYLLRLSLQPDTKDLDPSIGREFYPERYDMNLDESDEKDIKKKKDIVGDNLLFGGRALVFRRGYSKEITTGRLLLPKLDYLQASLVQRSTTSLTRRLGMLEERIEDFVLNIITQLNNSVKRTYQQLRQQCREFIIDMLENFGLSQNEFIAGLISQNIDKYNATVTSTKNKYDDSSKAIRSSFKIRGNKIFQLARYQTKPSSIISSIIPTSQLDLSEALSPFLLCEVGDNASNSTVEQDIYDGIKEGNFLCQYDSTLISNAAMEETPPYELTYIPDAVTLLERTSIQNTVDFFSNNGRRSLIKNYFKSSTLVEPSYEEVIVIWRKKRKKPPKQLSIPTWMYEVAKVFDMENRLPQPKNNTQPVDEGPMSLEIKAFYDVPMANIEAVLPKNKLVFKAADAIVFDLVSVFSFLAIAGSVKFDSPKLDLIALVSLVFFAIRTFFRYSNKYARYDLLVNKFLTSKLSHRGPGKSIYAHESYYS